MAWTSLELLLLKSHDKNTPIRNRIAQHDKYYFQGRFFVIIPTIEFKLLYYRLLHPLRQVGGPPWHVIIAINMIGWVLGCIHKIVTPCVRSLVDGCGFDDHKGQRDSLNIEACLDVIIELISGEN